MSTLGNDILLSYWAQNQGPLPSGFSECDYLESTGEQWIKTGLVWDADDYVLEAEAYATSSGGNPIVVGASAGNSPPQAFYVLLRTAEAVFAYGGVVMTRNPQSVSVAVSSGAWHTLRHDWATRSARVDGVLTTMTWSPSITKDDRNFFIFDWNENTAFSGHDPVRIRSVLISEAGDQKGVFIPALCLAGTTYADGNSGAQVTATADKPGMYDTVSKRFFVNQGTGADFNYQLK